MIVWPEYVNLKDWAGALLMDYPNEALPQLQEDEKWQEWGSIVASTGVFARAGIPAPFTINAGQKKDNFENWQQWAKAVYTCMAAEFNTINKIKI
jgi:hypothetical protein